MPLEQPLQGPNVLLIKDTRCNILSLSPPPIKNLLQV